MSSILKALRKLEEEKRGGKLEAPDLRVDQGQSAAAGKSFMPLFAGVALGALVVGLLFLWPSGSGQKTNVVSSEPTTAVPPAAPQQVVTESQPAPAATLQPQVTSAPARPAAPVARAVTEPAVPAERKPAVSKADRAIPATVVEKPVTPVKAPARQKVLPEPGNLPEGINLVVSEIFYQDAVNSMAVVNDLPVMVGSHVDSAVVTGISADQVLFEIDGNVFAVPVSQP